MEGNKVQNYKSCFDIIGPIMVGPSSSHTAGAIAIGALARQLFGGTPKSVRCDYYESFAETHPEIEKKRKNSLYRWNKIKNNLH